jgi:hypothetical protein
MMQTTTERFLDAWEQGLGQPRALQALLLLRAAHGDAGPAAPEHLTIGQRDAELLTLHEQLFGPELEGVTTCPNCGERLELSFRTAAIRAPAAPAAGEWSGEVSHDGHAVRFRLPHGLDVLAIEEQAERDAAAFRRALLARCVDAPVEELPPALLDEIAARMARADPQADVRLDLICPACDHHWQALFDIVSFLWRRLDEWATSTLYQVHQLASAYGWREADILVMSARRRQLYLDMIGE